MREKLIGVRSTPTAESRALLARVLYSRGRPEDAEREADAVLAMLRATVAPEADIPFAAMAALKGRAFLERHDPAAAEPWLIDTLTRRLRHLRPEDPDLLASLNDGADMAERLPAGAFAGHLAAAWQTDRTGVVAAVRRDAVILAAPDRGNASHFVLTGRARSLENLIRLQERLLQPNDPALVSTLTALMRAAEAEGLMDMRIEAALRAAEILERRFGGNDLSVLLCVEQAAAVLPFTGKSAQAAELGARACRIWEAVPLVARDLLLAANSRRRLGWYLAMAGRPAEAMSELRRSMEEIAQAVGREHRSFAFAESTLAFCLAETGDIEAAERASAHALALAEKLPATPIDQLAHNRFIRGHILRLGGRHAEARTALEKAWDEYFTTTGPLYPWAVVCVEDLAVCCESMGDASGAAKWRREFASRRSAPSSP